MELSSVQSSNEEPTSTPSKAASISNGDSGCSAEGGSPVATVVMMGTPERQQGGGGGGTLSPITMPSPSRRTRNELEELLDDAAVDVAAMRLLLQERAKSSGSDRCLGTDDGIGNTCSENGRFDGSASCAEGTRVTDLVRVSAQVLERARQYHGAGTVFNELDLQAAEANARRLYLQLQMKEAAS